MISSKMKGGSSTLLCAPLPESRRRIDTGSGIAPRQRWEVDRGRAILQLSDLTGKDRTKLWGVFHVCQGKLMVQDDDLHSKVDQRGGASRAFSPPDPVNFLIFCVLSPEGGKLEGKVCQPRVEYRQGCAFRFILHGVVSEMSKEIFQITSGEMSNRFDMVLMAARRARQMRMDMRIVNTLVGAESCADSALCSTDTADSGNDPGSSDANDTSNPSGRSAQPSG